MDTKNEVMQLDKCMAKYDQKLLSKLMQRFKLTQQEVEKDIRLQWMLKKCCDSEHEYTEIKKHSDNRYVGIEQRLDQLNATITGLIRILTAQVATKGTK